MRVFVCAFLLPMLLFDRTPQSPATFPIPKDMQEIWPGASLADADKLLLREAVESDLRRLNRDLLDDQRLKFESIDSADVDLGSLGKGVLITLSESVLWHGRLSHLRLHPWKKCLPQSSWPRKRMGPRWAFAVVKSKDTIPDLVIASNLSGGVIVLTLYRYSGKTFTSEGCETLTAKEGAPSGRSRFNPAAVVISPCGMRAP